MAANDWRGIKMKRSYRLFIRIAPSIFLILKSSITLGLMNQDMKGQEGIVDLTSFEFNKSNILVLNGPWEFYWKQLLTPKDFQQKEDLPGKSLVNLPGLWKGKLVNGEKPDNTGYATYRLQVIASPYGDLLAIKVPKLYSSYKIWINGRLKVACGKVGTDRATTVHRRKSHTLPFKLQESGKTEIIIQVANFYHKNGGISKAPSIGCFRTFVKREESSVIAETMLLTSLVLMGLAFLFLYSLWRKDKAVLYFAFFCLFWAYRGISDHYAPLVDIMPFLSWEFNTKLEYISLFFGSLAGCLYFNKIFKKNAYPRYNALVFWAILSFAIVTLLSPDTWFTYYLLPFFVVMLVNFVYITTIVIKSMIDKNPEFWYAVAGILLGVIVFTSHMFIFYTQRDSLISYINIGYLGFFFLSATLLGVRFSRAFFKLEMLQGQTFEQKEELKTQADMLKVVNDQMVHQKEMLQEKNEEIKSINKYLEHTISERTSRLRRINKELDMFLYRASHDLRRPISSIMGIDQIARMTVKEKEALDLFKKVQNVVQAMDMMLKKFISISEIYNHKIQFTEIDMNTLKSVITNQAAYYGKMNNIEDYQLDIYGADSIFSDLFIINKITTYLIENSFMFASSPGGEKLKISITFKENGPILSLIFSDNGDGIKKEIIDKIFNMYFIGTVKSNGNGLGLYIVKKAAEKLGEDISVESQKGDVGTTFCITLNKNK